MIQTGGHQSCSTKSSLIGTFLLHNNLQGGGPAGGGLTGGGRLSISSARSGERDSNFNFVDVERWQEEFTVVVNGYGAVVAVTLTLTMTVA